MNIVVLCAAFLVILYVALSVNVSRVRLQGRGSSRATEAQLTQAVRAHGNAAEYIPLLVVLLLYLDSVAPGPGVTALAALGALSRTLHAAAMLVATTLDQRHRLRFIGALGTYLALLGLGAMLLRHAF